MHKPHSPETKARIAAAMRRHAATHRPRVALTCVQCGNGFSVKASDANQEACSMSCKTRLQWARGTIGRPARKDHPQ